MSTVNKIFHSDSNLLSNSNLCHITFGLLESENRVLITALQWELHVSKDLVWFRAASPHLC